MAKPRFTQDQILNVLHEIEAGFALKEVSHKYGVSPTTLYRWRVKVAGKKPPVGDRLRSLEMENRQLKSRFAELTLDYNSLRAALIRDSKEEC